MFTLPEELQPMVDSVKPFAFTTWERAKIMAAIDAAVDAGLTVNAHSRNDWLATVQKNKENLINAVQAIIAEGWIED